MKAAKKQKGILIAVDGVNGAAVKKTAKQQIAAIPKSRRAGVSYWDASGIFDDLVVAGIDAGHASARTLVLLYAADLAFRLRWEIRPAVAEGRTVAAAPYVATGIAFGRAAGLPAGWLKDVFAFAMPADVTRHVDVAPARKPQPVGFIDWGCQRLAEASFVLPRRALTDRARKHLKKTLRG